MISQPANSTRHYQGLEVARGIGALLVFWSHSAPPKGDIISLILDPGKIGVVLFFCISGFLIPISLEKSGSISGFMVGRAFRLYPIYWLSIFMALILGWIAASPTELAWNFTMFQQFVGVNNVISVYWTLTVELFFYAVIIFLYWSNRKGFSGSIWYAVLAFGVFSVAVGLLRMLLHEKIPLAMVLGTFLMLLAAQIRIDGGVIWSHRWRIYVFAAACIVTSCSLGYSFDAMYGENPSRYIISYTVGFLAFLGFLHFGPVLKSATLARLGAVSYGVYLFHLPILGLVTARLGQNMVGNLSALALTLFVSYVAYVAIERPSHQFGRKLSRALGHGRS